MRPHRTVGNSFTRSLVPLSLRRCERADLRLELCVCERTQFRSNAARDCRGFAARLEAGEIRAIPPGEWSAQSHAGSDGGVVDDVDRPLVIRRALAVSGKVSEISACREYCRDAGHFRNGICVFQSFKSFDHQDQHDIVVDRVAITARYIAHTFGSKAWPPPLLRFPSGGK